MFKFMTALVMTLSLLGCTNTTEARVKNADKLPVIKLRTSNTVVLRGVVNYNSIKVVQKKLLELSSKLPRKSSIFLVLDTPGGSVSAGMELIQVAQAIPQRVITVTNFAASMGFITAQYLGPRYILPQGVLMSHRATAQISGQVPGEINTRLASTMRLINDLEVVSSKRMKIPLRTYKSLIFGEYWTHGKYAVQDGAADRVVRATCGQSMLGTTKETVDTIFGPVIVTWSKCPLISSPLGISFEQISYFISEEKLINLKKFINAMYSSDKKNFMKVYMSNNKYGEFLNE